MNKLINTSNCPSALQKAQIEKQELLNRIEKLQQENEIMREALEFYAASETYVLFKVDDTSQVVDRGTIAREALEKVKK